MGTTACDMQIRSRYKIEDKPHSQSASINLALVGGVVLMSGVGSSAWAMLGLSFEVGSNLAPIELDVISLKLNLVALGVVVW